MAQLPARAKWALVGLARDFWKDGPENPIEAIFLNSSLRGFQASVLKFFRATLKDMKGTKTVSLQTSASTPSSTSKKSSTKPGTWHAAAGEIDEKMWGAMHVLPGGDAVLDMLLKPIGLDKQTEVLDLSAGLGGLLHKAASEFGAYVTGLEPNPALAIRANEILVRSGRSKSEAIAYYTPDNFVAAKTVTKVYDCVIAREIFYRVKDKHKFFTALAVCTKPQAQVTFTDYVVNPEDRSKPAIAAWLAFEENAAPLGLVEMAEAWAQANFKLRVHSDQTHFYRREVLLGLQRFATFLASGIRPDEETRQDILRRMELWTYRLAAIEQGMKFFRFYGTKESIGIH